MDTSGGGSAKTGGSLTGTAGTTLGARAPWVLKKGLWVRMSSCKEEPFGPSAPKLGALGGGGCLKESSVTPMKPLDSVWSAPRGTSRLLMSNVNHELMQARARIEG